VSAADLSQAVTVGAAVVNAMDLGALRSVDDVPLAERVIVLADGPAGVVAVDAAKQAAERLGVDVVAYVDRAQIGDGRRKGEKWMVFPADGSRPKPAVTDPGPLTTTATPTSAPTQTTTPDPAPDVAPPVPPKTGQVTATALGAGSRTVPVTGTPTRPGTGNARVITEMNTAGGPRLPDHVVGSDYPWLTKINPYYAEGGDFATNCMLAAIYTDRTIEERSGGEPVHYQVPPSGLSPYEHLRKYRDRAPIPVADYATIVVVMTKAKPGARGLVIVGAAGSDIGHVFNVVHDHNGVVFLDGQRGEQAHLPHGPVRLEFLPTSDDFPPHALPAADPDGGTTRRLGTTTTAPVNPTRPSTETRYPGRPPTDHTVETQPDRTGPDAGNEAMPDFRPADAAPTVPRSTGDDPRPEGADAESHPVDGENSAERILERAGGMEAFGLRRPGGDNPSGKTEKRFRWADETPGGVLTHVREIGTVADRRTRDDQAIRPDEAGRSPNVDDPLPDDPYLFEDGRGRYRVGPRGLGSGWIAMGPVSTYVPVSWLAQGGPVDGLTREEVVRTDLDNATTFLTWAGRAAETADTVRAFLARMTGRTVERTNTLPPVLADGTWVWFTGPTRTGAAVVLPGGQYRIYYPDRQTTLTSDSGLSNLTGAERFTFVIAHPAGVVTSPTPHPLPAEGAVPAATRADPIPPWYAALGGFGDGTVASVSHRIDTKSVEDWVDHLTAGLSRSVAAAVRQQVLAVLKEDDPKVWEKLLRSGKLLVHKGLRVKLTFAAEDLVYEPPGDEADPGYQSYFSKYGDTQYSEGESEHVHHALTGRVEPLLFLAAAAHSGLSHVSPSVKITAESGSSSGRSIAMEVQSGNRVIANAAHVHRGRIRVRATVNRQRRAGMWLPGEARLSFPIVYSSAAEALARSPKAGGGGHPAVRVVEPTVLHGLDYAVNAMVPDGLLTGLRRALEELGLPEHAVEEIEQEIAEDYFNEKTMKDRSQWWLTDSWVSGLITEKVSRWLPDFQGHVEVSGKPHTVQYVTTTEQDVLLRNDIADTAIIRDGREHESGASITPGLALGFEVGDHLATPSFDLPKLKSTRGHGHTIVSEGQTKNATMRKERLVRYRTEFLMTVQIKSNKGDTGFTEPVIGELAIGRAHAKDFERLALGGKPTGSGLVGPEEFVVPAGRATLAPNLPRATAARHHPHETIEPLLRATGLNPIADFLREGGLPQIQVTDALRERLEKTAENGEALLSQVVRAMRTMDIPVVAADGSRLRAENGERGPESVRPPEKRFIIDERGKVRGPLRPWHHVVHPSEPIALAARKGLGRGIVRETPGLEVVYQEVQNALQHQMRTAGVADRLSANERQHVARVLAMKFGVPGSRGAYPALLDGGVSHEVRVGDHVFTVALDAELRALRRDPVAEDGVTLDAQNKGVASLGTLEHTGLELGGGTDIRFRAKLSRMFSLDLNILKFDAKRAWLHKIIDATGVKEYRRDKTGGRVTRFEYDAAYTLTVTTRKSGEGVAAAQVRELSGEGFWTAVTVSDAHLPKTPVPTDEILEFADVTVQRGPLDEDGVQRLAARPAQEATEFDLNQKGLTGIRVGLTSTSAISEQMADMVAAHYKRSWVGAKADPFQQVLAKVVPSGGRYGVTERILRSGTQTFLEANARAMLRESGLPIPLPPTPDGWKQEFRIRLRTFNAGHVNTIKGVTLEQYTEADLRFGEENGVVDGADAAGGPSWVVRIGGTPAEEGDHTTSAKSASQASGSLPAIVSGGLAGGRHTGDLGGGLDLNLGTYSGDSEQVAADGVYVIEYRRWRSRRLPQGNTLRKKHRGIPSPVSYTTTRHVKVNRGVDLLAPYVRAADHGLPMPPRDDLPKKDGERHYLDTDLAMAVAHVEDVDADGIVDAIKELLGPDADAEVLRAAESAFNKEAVRAQFGIARKGAINQIFKSPARLWQSRFFWRDYLQMPTQVNGTVHTGIRVSISNESVAYARPRPDVRVTTGGQGFVQTGKSRSRERAWTVSGFVHGRWASAPNGYRPAGGVSIDYERSSAVKVGTNTTLRDIRRATAADSSQEFAHDVTFRVEVFHSYSSSELARRAWQVLKAGPALVEILSQGESRRLWHRWFPPGRQEPATRDVEARAAVLVPTHLTTTAAPSVAPAAPARPVIIARTPAPAPSPLAEALAEHVHPLTMPGADNLPMWASAAAIPWRRIDHQAVSRGIAPIVDEFAPGFQDGLTSHIAFNERNMRANIEPLLNGRYRIPLVNAGYLIVQLVPRNARWLSRGKYTALNFPEVAEEPDRETEESRGWSVSADFDLGHPFGRPLEEGVEHPLIDPGGAFGRGSGKTRRVTTNATGDYVESNRQRDGDYDYYLFDADFVITGPHGHSVTVEAPNGFVGMLPVTVVQRLVAANPDLGLEQPPLSGDQLPAALAENGTIPRGAAEQIVERAGGMDAVRDRGLLRLLTQPRHMLRVFESVRGLADEVRVPVELLVRHDDGSISRYDAQGTPRRVLEDWLRRLLPPYDGTAADCVPRMEMVRSGLFGAGARGIRDDIALNSGRPENAFAAAVGGQWYPVEHSLAHVVAGLKELGSGATAFVLTSAAGRSRHAVTLRNQGGEIFWIETQAPAGERVVPITGDAPRPTAGSRVIMTDPSGRAVPLTGEMTRAASMADALVDRSTGVLYGSGASDLEPRFGRRRPDGGGPGGDTVNTLVRPSSDPVHEGSSGDTGNSPAQTAHEPVADPVGTPPAYEPVADSVDTPPAYEPVADSMDMPPAYEHPPVDVTEDAQYRVSSMSLRETFVSAWRLRVSPLRVRSLSRYEWFRPARLLEVGRQLGVHDPSNLVRLAETIGRIPDDVAEVAAELAPMTPRDVYRVSRDYRIDPRDLTFFGDRLREIYARPPGPGGPRWYEVLSMLQRYALLAQIPAFVAVARRAGFDAEEFRQFMRDNSHRLDDLQQWSDDQLRNQVAQWRTNHGYESPSVMANRILRQLLPGLLLESEGGKVRDAWFRGAQEQVTAELIRTGEDGRRDQTQTVDLARRLVNSGPAEAAPSEPTAARRPSRRTGRGGRGAEMPAAFLDAAPRSVPPGIDRSHTLGPASSHG
jgi:hypothetical protein